MWEVLVRFLKTHLTPARIAGEEGDVSSRTDEGLNVVTHLSGPVLVVACAHQKAVRRSKKGRIIVKVKTGAGVCCLK